MYYPELQIPAVFVAYCGNCDGSHPIGRGYGLFTWKSYDPLAVHVAALTTSGVPMEAGHGGSTSFWVARDTLYTAVHSGKTYGCPPIGEGDVICRVMAEQVTTMWITWKPGYTMLVDRDKLSRWIDDTYTAVPATAEDEILDVDNAIAKILEGSK